MTDSPKGERGKPRPLPSRDELRRKNAQRLDDWDAKAELSQPIISLKDKCDLELVRNMALDAGRTDADAVHDLCNWINEEGPILRATAQIPAVLKSADMTARDLLDSLDDALQQLLAVLAPTKRETQDEGAVRAKLRLGEVIGRIEDAYPPGTADETVRDRFRKDIDGMLRLREAVREARATISVKRGPVPLDGLHAGANALARKYEELSGKLFTFDRHQGAGCGRRSSPWLTDGARFVARGLRAIFPDVTDANLDSVMRGKTFRNSNLQKSPR